MMTIGDGMIQQFEKLYIYEDFVDVTSIVPTNLYRKMFH